MVTMFGWFKAASAWASRVKRSANFGFAHALRREQFQRDETVQGFLPRLIDHAHAAASEAFEDFKLRKVRARVPPARAVVRASAASASGWVGTIASAMRQRGQRPAVAAEGRAAPHFGQDFDDAVDSLIPVS